MSPTIVAIAGGTASGKTTIARALEEALGALVVTHDRYYKDVPDPSGHNYDHPDALDTDLLVEHLAMLRSGRPAPLPVYAFATHSRAPEVEVVLPRPVVIVEGILILTDPRVRALAHHRVYVDAPDDIRLARRMLRDLSKRGRTPDHVVDQYLRTVRPMHEMYVSPSRAHADLVLDGTAPVQNSVMAMREHLER